MDDNLSPEDQDQKKSCQVSLNVKILLAVFFYYKGIVYYKFLSQGRNVNKEHYLEVCMRNHEKRNY